MLTFIYFLVTGFLLFLIRRQDYMLECAKLECQELREEKEALELDLLKLAGRYRELERLSAESAL